MIAEFRFVMKKVTLYINSDGERQEVRLEGELSIGRTSQAKLALPDSGLSRLNTTFFIDGESVFVVDENSTNGTFVNGEQVFSSPRKLKDGDEISIGSNSRISIEIADKTVVATSDSPEPRQTASQTKKKTKQKTQTPQPNKQIPLLPVVVGISTLFLLFFGVAGVLMVSLMSDDSNKKPTPITTVSTELIPKRVIDPLGGEDPDDIDDLIASWENEDKSVDANVLAETQSTMTSTSSGTPTVSELIVPIEFFNKMINLAKEPRSPSGERPPGLNVTRDLCCGVPKQTRKLAEMVKGGYKQPLDYAELAEKKMRGDLIELPVATDFYVLDVGGNANDSEFTQFSWQTNPRSTKLSPMDAKYQTLQKLANNFDGQKYDLNNPSHRRTMKIRLLRMFNKAAKPILMEFAQKYKNKFNRPLRITSLTRSMEYQISLNANNANSFKVSGEGSLPPHTSGCAFDLARKQMTVDEQNFMIQTLTEMEQRGILDALIEYNANSCFHVFIYADGKPPVGF